MIVAHVSLTPLAGAVWAAAEAFREAGYDSFCIAPDATGDGRDVPTDYRAPPVGGAIARLHRADAVFCHDGWPYGEQWYPPTAPTVGWFHTPPESGARDRRLVESGWPWGVSGSGDTRRAPGRPPLPELVPLKHRFYQAGEKPAERVRIAYCPSDSTGGRSGQAACGCVLGALDGLSADVEVIPGGPPASKLRRMAAAHVVIDGCDDGSYGRSSLEALALGCVAVNRCDARRAWAIQRMTGGCGHPFEVADLGRLREALRRLVGLGPEALAHMGRRNRRWMEAAWRPVGLIERNLRPLMEAAAARQVAGVAPEHSPVS